MKICMYVFAVFGLYCLMAEGADQVKVVLWASNPLEKIFQDSLPPEKINTKAVSIEALRNEYEPAQVCITSRGYQGPVRIRVGPLVHLSGEYRISDVNARFVGYIPTPERVPGSEKFPFADSPDAYPDPLIWDEEVTLKLNQTQPVWITVKVPEDALPGKYEGNIEVITTTGNAVLPLHLTVYPVTLPETGNFHLGSWGGDTKLAELFGVIAQGEWQKGNYTPEYIDYLKNETIKNRREHRSRAFSDQPFWEMNIVRVFWKDGGYVYDYTLLDKLVSTVEAAYAPDPFRVTCLGVIDKTTKANGGSLDENGLLTSRITVLNPDGSVNKEKSFDEISTDDPRYRAYIGEFFKAMSSHLREKGWQNKVYFKVLDEPTDALIGPVLQLNAYIRQTAPGIHLDATYWEPISAEAMAKAVDIDLAIANSWTLDVSEEAAQAVRQETRSGREFWLYNDPKVVIDAPLIHTRKVGWLCSFYGAKGYMHWAYCWKSDPWENAFDPAWGFGAHFLVYPDLARKKIVDSIRWEMLRETAEDYDTLCLLEKAGGDSRKFVELVTELSGSGQDPERFYQIRHQLLLELNRLSQ